MVLVGAGQARRDELPHVAEHLYAGDRNQLARVVILTEKLENLAPTHDNLLNARVRELTVYASGDGRCLFEGEIIEMHYRVGSGCWT